MLELVLEVVLVRLVLVGTCRTCARGGASRTCVVLVGLVLELVLEVVLVS